MLLLTPHPLLDLLVSLCALAVIGVLYWQLHKARKLVKLAAGAIDELRGQLEASNTVMHVQAHAIYDQACQLHGKAAVDRAMQQAHERGRN